MQLLVDKLKGRHGSLQLRKGIELAYQNRRENADDISRQDYGRKKKEWMVTGRTGRTARCFQTGTCYNRTKLIETQQNQGFALI